MSVDETDIKLRKNRKPSQTTHVYHFNVNTDNQQEPLCGQIGAKLFASDRQVFLDSSEAEEKGFTSVCIKCKRILKNQRNAIRNTIAQQIMGRKLV